jgi:hypothetical protein
VQRPHQPRIRPEGEVPEDIGPGAGAKRTAADAARQCAVSAPSLAVPTWRRRSDDATIVGARGPASVSPAVPGAVEKRRRRTLKDAKQHKRGSGCVWTAFTCRGSTRHVNAAISFLHVIEHDMPVRYRALQQLKNVAIAGIIQWRGNYADPTPTGNGAQGNHRTEANYETAGPIQVRCRQDPRRRKSGNV